MADPESTDTRSSSEAWQDEAVELVLSADRSLVRVARVTASGIASRLGFSWDEIEDLRLAVDELSHALLVNASKNALLRLRFTSKASSIEVEGLLERSTDVTPRFSPLADQILAALVDQHEVRPGDGGPAVIWLRKQRGYLMAQPTQLSREEIRHKFSELAVSRDPALRAELVEAHLGLAEFLARRFAHRGEAIEDLIQVGSLALVKAVDRFDPERGVEFTTYATHTIAGELKRHFRDRGWAIRAPRRMQELYLRLGEVVARLSQELKRNPTIAEIARAAGVSEEETLEAMEAGRGYRSSSLDDGSADREEDRSPWLGVAEPGYEAAETRAVIGPLVAKLPYRRQMILRLRFEEGLTQSEIATRLGISQMHVSRLLARSLDELRAGAGVQAGPSSPPLD